jgi:hypothetical protein
MRAAVAAKHKTAEARSAEHEPEGREMIEWFADYNGTSAKRKI